MLFFKRWGEFDFYGLFVVLFFMASSLLVVPNHLLGGWDLVYRATGLPRMSAIGAGGQGPVERHEPTNAAAQGWDGPHAGAAQSA